MLRQESWVLLCSVLIHHHRQVDLNKSCAEAHTESTDQLQEMIHVLRGSRLSFHPLTSHHDCETGLPCLLIFLCDALSRQIEIICNDALLTSLLENGKAGLFSKIYSPGHLCDSISGISSAHSELQCISYQPSKKLKLKALRAPLVNAAFIRALVCQS